MAYRATDRLGNASGVNSLRVPAAPTAIAPLAVTAEARCVDGSVRLTVSALNEAATPVGVTTETAYGESDRTMVEPGTAATATYDSGEEAVPAGSATVTGVGGERSVTVYTVAHPEVSCG